MQLVRTLAIIALLAACGEDAATITDVTDLVATSDRLCWRRRDGALFTASLAGDDLRAIATPPATTEPGLGDLRITPTGIFWTATAGGGDLAVWHANLDGTAPAPVVTLHQPATSTFDVDATAVYFTRPYDLVAQPLDGGPERTLSSGRGVITSLAATGGSVYFPDGGALFGPDTNGIWVAAPNNSSVDRLTFDHHGVAALVADDSGIYWSRTPTNSLTNDVRRIAATSTAARSSRSARPTIGFDLRMAGCSRAHATSRSSARSRRPRSTAATRASTTPAPPEHR